MTYHSWFPVKWWQQNKKKSLKILLPTLACLYLFSEAYYLLTRFNLHLADLTLYYETADKITAGHIPYKDFRIEYPFFAIVPILLPGLINILFGSTFKGYCLFFGLQNILYAAGTVISLSKTKINNQPTESNLRFYAILILISLPIYLFRYDAFPAFLTSIAVYGLQKKAFLSGIIWIIATGSKLYPVVLGPVFLIYYVISGKVKKLWEGVAGVVVCLLLCLTIILPIFGSSIFDVLKLHKLRGIQIESVAGGFLLFLHKIRLVTVNPVFNFGSVNIDTPLSQKFLTGIAIITPVIFVFLLLYFIRILLYEKRLKGTVSPINVIRAFGIMILSFVLLNKVLSPQYVIWLFPFIPFYNHSVRIKFIITLMLTVSIFPGWYHYLVRLNPAVILVLNIRNLLLIWILIDILRQMGPEQELSESRAVGTGTEFSLFS